MNRTELVTEILKITGYHRSVNPDIHFAIQDALDSYDECREYQKKEPEISLIIIKQIIDDMVYVAKEDNWNKSTTGRQLILRDAEKLLKELGREDETK